jgi:hypothetical protein
LEIRPPEPPPHAQSWSQGLAPRYIALFLLVVYFDQLPRRPLAIGGLLPSAGGLAIGAIFAVLLFFRPLALSGLVSRGRLEDVCARTFGPGAAWLVPGLTMGLAHVVWFAVAIDYATDVSLRGLVGLGLIDASVLQPQRFGGRELPGGLVLWVAVVWSLASAFLGLLTYRLVAAVMAGYQPFVAVALAVAAGWALPKASGFIPSGVDPLTDRAVAVGHGLAAAATMIEFLLGFFATHAALGVDWGRASREPADVEIGGWVGIALAALTTGCLALLIVAGAEAGSVTDADSTGGPANQDRPALAATSPAEPELRLTVREALSSGLLPAPVAGILFLVLGVGLLGPVCFAPLLIARFMGILIPSAPSWAWTLLGAVGAWPLILLRIPQRLDLVLTGLGITIGPMLGVLAADWWRTRGRGAASPGIRIPALMAWLAGMVFGGVLAVVAQRSTAIVPTLAAYAVACLVALPFGRRAVESQAPPESETSTDRAGPPHPPPPERPE